MSRPALISGYKARVAHAVPASTPPRVPLRAKRGRLRRARRSGPSTTRLDAGHRGDSPARRRVPFAAHDI